MPTIVDYPVVRQRMLDRGFVSLYHNSGAFGFGPDDSVQNLGLVTTDDPSIRESARAMMRLVTRPAQLDAVERVCRHIRSDAWLMPKSHWHYELHFGNSRLLEGVLQSIPIDPAVLRDRNDGSAIAFEPAAAKQLLGVVTELLPLLRGSDFMIAWPDGGTLCTIHHHGQLWWQTTDKGVAAALDGVAPASR